jgi:L-alanine-DL-glutamate epimerase-like enolase superfamily enzyme
VNLIDSAQSEVPGRPPIPLADDSSAGSVVTKVETYALAVPLPRPPEDSHAALSHWVVPAVEITTADGNVGTGISGVHTGADLITLAIDRYYAPQLLGRPAADVREVWHRLYWSPLQWIGRAGATHMALAMVDIAVWDLAAQRAQMPLWRLLGGHFRTLRAYNTDGGWLNRSVAELVEDMQGLVEEGWSAVKMKVGKNDWREDVDRVRAVRSAIGSRISLMVDANKHWDLATALRILPFLEEADVDFIEEPLHPDDVRSHRRLQASTRVPLAIGESLYSRHQFSEFIHADAARVLQPDCTRLGVTEYLEVAAEANQAALAVVPHAGDMAQVHQHLGAAAFAEEPRMIEFIPWTREIYLEQLNVVEGEVVLPTSPGDSTRIDPAARGAWAIPEVGGVRAV